MKSVIIKGLVFLGLFFATDFVAGLVIGHFYTTSKNINIRDANYGFSGNVQDNILIFGASELSHAVISNRMSEKSGLSTYNLACDACGIHYQYPLLETILNKHIPKAIMLSSNQMNKEDLRYISKLYPFYRKNGYVKRMVDELFPEEYLKLAFQGYIYNSNLIRVFDSKSDNMNGYVPLYPEDSRMDFSEIGALPVGKNSPITTDTEHYFLEFVQKARDKGVKVYICVPPVLQKINPDYYTKMTAIVEASGAKLIDLSKDRSFLDNAGLFFDKTHLNHEGAKVVTDRFLQVLKDDGVY